MPNNSHIANSRLNLTRRQELARSFRDWEQLGRGNKVFDFEIELEPHFSRFTFSDRNSQVIDDARNPSSVGRLFSRNNRRITTNQTQTESVSLPLPRQRYCAELTSFQINLPNQLEFSLEQNEQLLRNLANSSDFVSFETIATSKEILFQITCPKSDKQSVNSKLKHNLPAVNISLDEDLLKTQIQRVYNENNLILDFGLGKDWFIPLPSDKQKTDLLLPLIAASENLADGEIALLQILFSRVKHNWQQAVREIIYNQDGRLRFSHFKSFESSIKEKLSNNLLAGQIRLFVQSKSQSRSREIAKDTRAFFHQFSSPNLNELIPLNNDCLESSKHFQSILNRTSYRSGILLSPKELSNIIHLPSDEIQSKKLKRDRNLTKSAPPITSNGSLILGENHHRNKIKEVSLSIPQRTRHMHLIGATGTGKSNLMLNLIKQDLDNGNGVCVLDPHGDLIDEVVSNIPKSRIDDVIFFDPADIDYPIGFNVLKANSELEKTLLASDLTSAFRRLSTSWGDVMDSVLANSILAFVESDRGGTLFDLKRFLIEKEFRDEFLETVNDDAIKYFWRNEFPLLGGKPSSSILIRLDSFLRQKLIRNIVCQKESTLNFRSIMDGKKILLLKLSQGAIGAENSFLLGTLLMSKLHQIALSRQDTTDRPIFALYIDEFQNFITPSMESVLSGIRKFNIALHLSMQQHQQIQSRNSDVASSVLSNCYTRICFRLGDGDSERFARGFSFFEAKHLQNLGIGEAIARVERAEYDFNLKTFLLPKVEAKIAEQRKQAVIDNSRTNYAKLREEVEAEQHFAQEVKNTNLKSKAKETPSVSQNRLDFSPLELTSNEATKQSDSIKKNGLGGEHHQDFQDLIKRMAESNGFSATIEKNILSGKGKVDVSLENKAHKIAVEVSVTTNAKQELRNIKKCLKAEYDFVVVVVSNQKKIPTIQEKVESELTSDILEKVKVLTITGLLEFLWKLTNYKPKRTKKSKGDRLNVTEAGEFLDKSPSTIYRWVQEGKLPFYKVGREYQFDREELALIGRHDLSGKGKANVDLPPLEIKKRTPKTKKKQNKRYRKMLGLE